MLTREFSIKKRLVPANAVVLVLASVLGCNGRHDDGLTNDIGRIDGEIERLVEVLRPGSDRYRHQSASERQEAIRDLGAFGQHAVQPLQNAIQQHERFARAAEPDIKYLAAVGETDRADYYITYISVVRSDLKAALRLAQNTGA